MKVVKAFIAFALICALAVQPAVVLGQHCVTYKPTVHYGHATYQNYQTYQHKDYAAYFPIAVFVPTPIFTTSKPAPEPKVDPLKDRKDAELLGVLKGLGESVRTLNSTVGQLNDRVSRVEAAIGGSGPPGPAPAPLPPVPQPQPAPAPTPTEAPPAPAVPGMTAAPAVHPGLTALIARCTVCHDRAVAAEKGGGRAFFIDGNFVASDSWKKRIVGSIRARMPPRDSGITLSDTERAAITSYLPPSRES